MKCAPLVLAYLVVQPSGAFGPAPCQAQLEVAQQQASLTITGYCRSLIAAPARYRYQLLTKRHSRSGYSQNSQGGEFALTANQVAVLSRVHLTTGPNNAGTTYLLVFDAAGQVVSQDSTHF
ncbi:curli-like amyloid fiber formation chaperone CsgH [Hymenobacter frigidus]|jgi:hypothetical protein|uniref:curli-like amyloid fiber formation chaperone CsgH n=1 Tax=Hymenobacter frigidus TaxID=1524095 RepID=UPI003570E438